jgi:hypothetical protein
MLNEIAEDETVHAVCSRGVEGFLVEAGGDVDEVEGRWVKICGDDDVKGGEVAGDLCGDSFCVDVDAYTRVQLLDVGTCGLSAVLANWVVFFLQKELGAKIGFSDDGVIEDSE